jgi:HemY protein
MIWSLVRAGFFLGFAAALALALSWLLQVPGAVRIAFAGREVSATPVMFVLLLALLFLALWLLLRLSGLVAAGLRFLAGDTTAVSRYLDRNRERRGFDALTQSLLALQSGEADRAQAEALRAERLLGRPDLAQVLKAQAAEAGGNGALAEQAYRAMLGGPDTRFAGLLGLMKRRMAAGDHAKALKLAEKAAELRPRHPATLEALFALQTREADWAGARRTIGALTRAKIIPRAVSARREAVVLAASALAAQARGEAGVVALEAGEACRLAPGLVPAVALSAASLAAEGNLKGAQRLITRAWAREPHPLLAAAWAGFAAGETPSERRSRFEPLLKSGPTDHREARLLTSELALAAEDFPAARRAFGTGEPADRRETAVAAALARGEGRPDDEVRALLTRAINAPPGPAWVCSNCGQVHDDWAALCTRCAGFDTLGWGAGAAGGGLPVVAG